MEKGKHTKLSAHTTLKVGGTASTFVSVKNEEELLNAVRGAKEEGRRWVVLGEGSNVLISDQDFDGWVIKNEIKGIRFEDRGDDVIATASSGESWDAFVKETVERGLWGLENLSGIPGTVGAAPVQNIGAYGTEVKDTISTVTAYNTETLEKRVFSTIECQFGYRESFFKTEEGKPYIIIAVSFLLKKKGVPALEYKDLRNYFAGTANPTLTEIRKAILEIRSKKFPDLKEVGTAGSFFKNPIVPESFFVTLKGKYPDIPGFVTPQGIKIPLAWIFEHVLQKKGYRVGDVALFERQPLVLVNFGKASAEEIDNFAENIVQEIFEKTGIRVEREVNRLNFE